MNKQVLNQYGIALAEKTFEEQGFSIEKSPVPRGKIDFFAVSNGGKTMKIKVRAISQIGSYVFIEKRRFNIYDPDLFMAVAYMPHTEEEKIVYLIPATEWGKDIYPLKGKDYNKPGQVSEPEWGISFSKKAKDAMETYRFSLIISTL